MISAIGPGVTEHKVGDRVFVGTALSFDLTGCYAEKVKGISISEDAWRQVQARPRGTYNREKFSTLSINRPARSSGSIILEHCHDGASGEMCVRLFEHDTKDVGASDLWEMPEATS